MLTQAYLKELFDYDPETGILVWKIRADARKEWNTRYAGKIAGGFSRGNGYETIAINNVKYYVHRVIWTYVHGEDCAGCADHINVGKTDNRATNLRKATKSENGLNRGPQVNNRSGHKNVFWNRQKSKWQVKMRCGARDCHFGFYSDIDMAALVASEARDRYHGEFARHV